MRRFTRWEDYLAGACGAYAALSVLWTERTMMSTILMVTFGAVLVVTAALNLSLPGEPWLEWTQAAAGVLLFVSPWVGAYSGVAAPAWTSWIAGGLAAVTTTLAIRPAMRAHDHMVSTH